MDIAHQQTKDFGKKCLAKMLSTAVFRAIGNGNVPSSISQLLTARNSSYNLRGDAIL